MSYCSSVFTNLCIKINVITLFSKIFLKIIIHVFIYFFFEFLLNIFILYTYLIITFPYLPTFITYIYIYNIKPEVPKL